jgi:hypothetical protein
MHGSSHIIRDVVIALTVGTAIGTTAGLWTSPNTPHPLAAGETHASAPRPAAESPRAVAGTGGVQSKPRAREKPAPIQATAPPAASRAPVAEDSDIDLDRARELAQRADVNALLAVRDRVARRVQDAGEQDAPAAKHQLEQIDRHLADARALRLRLDAQDFRKGVDRR